MRDPNDTCRYSLNEINFLECNTKSNKPNMIKLKSIKTIQIKTN